MHNHTDYICSAFPHCVFLNDSSNGQLEKMWNYIGCICLVFLRCGFSNVMSNFLYEGMHSHIGCICWTFPHCAFLNEPSNSVHGRMQSHIGCICLTFLHCAVAKCLPQNTCLKFLHCPPLFPSDFLNWPCFFVHDLDPSTASAHSKLRKNQDMTNNLVVHKRTKGKV